MADFVPFVTRELETTPSMPAGWQFYYDDTRPSLHRDGTAQEYFSTVIAPSISGFNGFPYSVPQAPVWDMTPAPSPYGYGIREARLGYGTQWAGPITRQEAYALVSRVKRLACSISGSIGITGWNAGFAGPGGQDASVTFADFTMEAKNGLPISRELGIITGSGNNSFSGTTATQVIVNPADYEGPHTSYTDYSYGYPISAERYEVQTLSASCGCGGSAFQIGANFKHDKASTDWNNDYYFSVEFPFYGGFSGQYGQVDTVHGFALYGYVGYAWGVNTMPRILSTWDGTETVDTVDWTSGGTVLLTLPHSGRILTIPIYLVEVTDPINIFSGSHIGTLATIDAADFIVSVEPSEYWPYKNSSGNAVWDTATGENIAPVS